MNCSIRIKSSASKEVSRVSEQDRARIVAAIDGLARPSEGDLRGLRRLRVGEYRVVYEVKQDVLVVMVVRVARRNAAYRHRPR